MWAAQWSKAIRERLTGAPICQLNQMAALRASSRWRTRVHSPAGTRPPWRSRPSWFLPQHLRGGWRLVRQPPQRGLYQRGGGLQPLVVLALAQQPGKQVPGPGGCGAQPVPLVVKAQQHLRHRQACQLSVGDLRRLARPGPGQSPGGDDAVGQLGIECDQKSVQIGDHDDFPRSDVCRHADLGHSSPADHGSATACPGRDDLRRFPGQRSRDCSPATAMFMARRAASCIRLVVAPCCRLTSAAASTAPMSEPMAAAAAGPSSVSG